MALRAVPDHPKFAELKALLKQPKGPVAGWLEMMWHFTGRFTPRGNIGKYSDHAIESWVEWDGEHGALIEAFIATGWIDRDPVHRLLVHDWADHADKAAKNAIGRSKLDFCTPTIRTPSHSGEHVRTEIQTGGLPVPEPVPEPEPEPGSATRVSSPAKLKVVRDESWEIFSDVALRAGMRASDDEFRNVGEDLWPPLDYEQKRLAIDGVKLRVASGEYADPAFVPLLENYVKKRLWTRPPRAAPSRGMDRKAAANKDFERRVLDEARKKGLVVNG